jgi:hypothetical protein
MANLKITIDGQDFTDFIQGTESLSERFFQSDDLKGYLIEVNGDIQCRGEAYDYLREQFRSNFRSLAQVEIVRITGVNQEKIFDGLIKLSTTEFDLISRVATCELMDNSYMSLIDNNKQIPAVLNAGQSKNGQQITPATQTTGFDMFNYKTGQYASAYAPDAGWTPPAPFIYGTVEGYYLLDAFDYLVRFMSNGQVDGVVSDYLDYNATSPTVAAECALFLGKYLRLREFNEAPEISFYELFRDCHKLFNIWFTIEKQSDGTLKMRIEEYDYFRRRVSNNQIECKTLNDGTFDESLFSSIRVGSAIDDDGYTGRQRFRFQFKEKYGTTGQEGNDTELDLELEKLITCTNCIKRSMMTTLRGGQETTAYRRALNTGTAFVTVPLLVDSTDQTFADSQTKRGDLVIKAQTNQSAVCGEDGEFLTNPDRQTLDLDIFTTDPVPYQMFQADTQFDNDVFLIYCPDKQAEKTQIATLEYVYNDSINNISCVQNHLSGMPSGIAKFLPTGGNNFRAGFDDYTNPIGRGSVDPTYFQQTNLNLPLAQYGPGQQNYIVKLQDTSTSPNFDTASNYDPTTGYFTAPADGYYSFFFNVWVSGIGVKAATISKINASNTAVLDATVFNFYGQPTGKLRLAQVVGGFFLTAGESVVAGIVEDAFFAFAITNIKSSFSNQGTVVSGNDFVQTYFASLGEDFTGIIGTTDDRNSDLLAINGEGTIASSVWNQIKAQPFNNVQFNYGSNLYLTARPVEIERNILSGDTSYRAIRNFDFGTEPFNENAPQ